MEDKKQATRDRGIDMDMEGLTPSNVVLTPPPPVTFETSSLPSEPGTSQNKMLASEATFSNKRSPPAHDEAPLLKRSTISSQLQQSTLPSDDDAETIKVAGMEGDTAALDEPEWFLCKPAGLNSEWWKYFEKFNARHHSEKRDKAACLMCFEEKNFHRGTVACKGGTTSGLKRHLQIHHRKEYEGIMQKSQQIKTLAPHL